ncbi:MAG: sulfurtransferase-like selenium metabolism protein YedF [Syntrophomonas sp.]|nr:sulfurtransferase-like selenium metabolism protein YedF [Syntrophomonas sp.]
MSRTVDARGLSCPQPVILTKRVMDEKTGDEIITLVDNPTSLENVCKLAKSQGYRFTVEELGAVQHIHMLKESAGLNVEPALPQNIAILVKSQFFGEGSDELGAVLMKSFLYTLTESVSRISHLIFMNSGVYLCSEGSPVLDYLREFERQGVQILSCGTCLDYFSLKEKLQVGEVTNMYNATEILLNAGKTIVF